MIINSNSYFRKPPKVLLPKQVTIFDAILYSIDICDLSYLRLRDNLYNFVYSDSNSKPSFPLIFSDVWSIFQHTSIFLKIVQSQLGIKLDDPLFDGVRDVIDFRDTSQHLDERLTQILTKDNLPVYGALSWYSQPTPESTNGIITVLYSGTVTNKPSIKSTGVDPYNKSNDTINDIEFTGIIRPNRRLEEFREHKILLNELIDKLIGIIEHFDRQIDAQLSGADVSERHTSDLILQLSISKRTVK